MIKEFLFPQRCPVCTKVVRKDRLLPGEVNTLPQGVGLEELICPHCYGKLSFVTGDYCLKCGRPVRSDREEYCENCRRSKPSFELCRGMLNYADPDADRMVWDIKYNNKREYADFIAAEMARRYGREIFKWGVSCIIPVPVHPSKKRKRGYNQAEVIAERLGGLLNLPVLGDGLMRVKKTAPQKELDPGKRAANLAGAFAAGSIKGDEGTVLLIDDIYTTGATMETCTRVLLAAGVKKVYCLACCTVGNEN